MLGDVIIILVVVLGFLGIAIATIVILSKYANTPGWRNFVYF